MPDAWGRERPQPVAVGPPRRRMSRADRMREARRRRRHRLVRSVTLCVFIVIVIGAVFLGSRLWHNVFGGGSDYSGEGRSDVVIQVHEGDSTTTIGKTLEDQKVVATSRAFVNAAQDN
ncbi:MAG TPA: aminodeoxychorismate lyase, partial [Mycobacterium sp.]|nr:aminodeoxychorismate lyase [Mycobacterium sp.]